MIELTVLVKLIAVLSDTVVKLELRVTELENHPLEPCTCTRCKG